MLTEVSQQTYRKYFPNDPHPYLSEAFIGIVSHKADRIIRLMDESDHSLGLILGVIGNKLYSPFSAPFGGFHYSHEFLIYDSISNFLEKLKIFIQDNKFKEMHITLPPDIYQNNMNAKLANAFVRLGYEMKTPDITNWLNLHSFNGTWVYSKVGNRCRRAVRNKLRFEPASDEHSKMEAFELIRTNRLKQNREIHMNFDDLKAVEEIFPVDYFLIRDDAAHATGAGIFYRGHDKVVQGIFMGDDLNKRDLGTIDFLYLNLYEHYKQAGFNFIDFGTSSQNGDPNVGLIRFKEIHNCETSLRHTFSMNRKD